MSTTTVTLNKKQWISFCKVLTGLARACNDVDINDGMIRQRSNDRSAIVEIDLRPVVGGLTFTIANVKEKLKTLKMFKRRLTITLGEKEAVLSDGISDCTIVASDINYLDNKFMSQQEMESLLQAGCQEKSLVVRNIIKKIVLKRIRTALSRLHPNTLKVVFAGHSGRLRVDNSSGSNGPTEIMDAMKHIILFQPIIGYAALTTLPFQALDSDEDLLWELYREDKRLLCKHSGRIGQIKATMYTVGELKSNPPELQRQAKRQKG